MNWYKIFYWISVADNIKSWLDTLSNVATWIIVISFLVWIILSICRSIEMSDKGESDDYKAFTIANILLKKIFYTFLIIGIVSWGGWAFMPSKKDALIIVAGGTVGNFITRDSSAKQIPSEVMTLLRDKIRSEIKEIHLNDISDTVKDTLESKSKEELIKLLREK